MTTSKNLRLILGLALAGCLTACGGGGASHESTTPETTEGSGTAIESSADVQSACTNEMRRERECTAEFIPALIALRARLDHPTGFAARDAADHASTLAAAETEWRTDSTDERIAATCRDVSRLSPSELAGFATAESECLAAADCAGFVECDIRFTEHRFHARMVAEGEHPAEVAAPPAQ